ncbi:MAG TPA: exodeoxyribonuclease VII small subunit [Acidimicrobiales bacterium]|nr:exodeoxyribonuclease VII small subunit [Acidimicrobiales bacterium]
MTEPRPDLGSLTFEQLLEELESLTAQMATGDVGIEEAADLYERAGQVYRAAADRLEAVQARIDRLRSDQSGS